MDYNLLFLMLAACFCGSIKNSLNLPDEFAGRMAKPVEPNRQYPKYLPHWMEKYEMIDDGRKNDIEGNTMDSMIISYQTDFIKRYVVEMLIGFLEMLFQIRMRIPTSLYVN